MLDILMKASVIVLVALLNATAAELLGYHRVSDAETEQLGVLQVPQGMRSQRQRAVLVRLAVSLEEGLPACLAAQGAVQRAFVQNADGRVQGRVKKAVVAPSMRFLIGIKNRRS